MSGLRAIAALNASSSVCANVTLVAPASSTTSPMWKAITDSSPMIRTWHKMTFCS